MRKALVFIVSFALLSGFWSMDCGKEKASAAAGELQIRDIIDQKTMLMSDGSVWSKLMDNRLTRTPGNVASITFKDVFGGLGVTEDGKLVEFNGSGLQAVEGQTGVRQASGYYWLKNDGTVWSESGKIKNLADISLISYGDNKLGALSRNGDILLEDLNKLNVFKKLGTIPDATEVKAITVYDSAVALLYTSGKVVLYQTFEFDDNGNIIPFTVTDDAVHIAFAEGTETHYTEALIVTRKDGTVWTTGNYKDRIKLTNQMQGLNGIVKTSVLDDCDHFFAQRGDGSWLFYNEGDLTPVKVPSASQINVSVTDLKPFVGDTLKIDIQEIYSNGAKIKVPAGEGNIEVVKPSVLQIQPNGSLKVHGVGKTQVTVTSGGLSKTVTVYASLRSNLKYAKLANGIIYVPSKSVFQSLGGTVSSSGGEIDVKIGENALSFKAKDITAKLNGETITLKAAPLIDKGETLIPASLLTEALGASVKWDGQWKQAEISFGDAHMTVVSAETASLIKRASQGILAKYIGKTYWVNYFQEWERFSKVTITDILPDGTGSFVIVFKSGAGKTLKSYAMSSSSVSQLLSDRSSFFNYNPYNKYKWSATIWNQIKAGHISLGMTKEQVQFSWGDPAGKSTTTANGKTIETWVYTNFDTVGFLNGKVIVIVS